MHERRVPFVGMPGCGVDANRAQNPNAPHAQNPLLTQPNFGAASVELRGELPVGRIVLGKVRIQQVDRHASHQHAPGGDVDVAPEGAHLR